MLPESYLMAGEASDHLIICVLHVALLFLTELLP